jgi:hypothetical protein
MVLTVSSALSPVIGLFCHRRKRNAQALSPLDASVEASGPHDFTVRVGAFRQAHQSRPPHPAPTVRDDRDTSLLRERDGAGSKGVSTKRRSGIFLREGLDREFSDLPVEAGQVFKADVEL